MESSSSDNHPIRALHFADVHFGVETYGRYDPATGLNSRLTDFKLSLTSCIKMAIGKGIEIALFAGDAYKSRDPSQTHQRAFAECIGLLTSAGIPVVLLAGNHDIPNMKGKANALEIYGAIGPELITVLDKPGVALVKTKSGKTLQIAAVPYLTKSDVLAGASQNATLREGIDLVAEHYEELVIDSAVKCAENPDIPTVLMGHFTVIGAQISSNQSGYLINESQVPKSALVRDEFDYIALGHIHRHQDLNFAHQPPLVYSGSPDRIDFGENAEQKGAVIVDICRGHSSYEFVESKARPFLNIVIDASKPDNRSEDDSPEAFDPTDTILAAIAKYPLESAVVKLTYKLSAASVTLVRDAEIRKALRPAAVVVSIQREVVGATDTARARSPLTADSSDPLAALNAYIDTKESLANHKGELMAKAEQLWQELTKADVS